MTLSSSRGRLLKLPLQERRPGVRLIGAENKCFVLHLFLEVVVEAGDKAEAGVALEEVREDIIEAVLGIYAPGLASWGDLSALSALSAAELAFFVAVDSLEAQEGGEALEAGEPLGDGANAALDDVREDVNAVGTCAPGLASCSA